jgi:hypothetical protein
VEPSKEEPPPPPPRKEEPKPPPPEPKVVSPPLSPKKEEPLPPSKEELKPVVLGPELLPTILVEVVSATSSSSSPAPGQSHPPLPPSRLVLIRGLHRVVRRQPLTM